MTPPAPRFAIVGAGGVGGCLGAALDQAGFKTTFIARGVHLRVMQEIGLRIEAPDGGYSLAVDATDDPARIGPVDYVLFAVKLWDTEAVATACRPLLGPGTAVITLQNGVEAAGILASVLGLDHVMCGVAEISAAITAPGTVTRFSPFQRIRVGEYDRTDGGRLRVLADCCAAAGIDFDRPSDIHAAVWSKFVFLVGVSSMTALTRRPIGAVRSDLDTRAMLRSIMEEAYIIGSERGVALPVGTVDAQLAFVDTLPSNLRASMALDVEHGKRLELQWLSGAVSRMGKELGIPTPANDFVVAALKLLDCNWASGS